MNWIPLLQTVVLCLIAITIEAVSVTKAGKVWFESLQQPTYSFSFSFWYVIGGLYYLVCGVIAYRQLYYTGTIYSTPVMLLAAVMVVNGLSNFVLFRFRSLRMFYLTLFPFILLFVALIVVLFQKDKTSVILASVYLLWLCYDLYYFYYLWKLNQK